MEEKNICTSNTKKSHSDIKFKQKKPVST